MTRRLALAGIALAAGAVAQAPAPARAFVEVEAAATTVWLQQACELRVRIGVDAAWFAAHALPLVRQPLDQPFVLTVPWLLGAEDRAVSLLPAPDGVRTQRIAIGDRIVAAAAVGTRLVDGRRFELLEVRYRWLPLAPGTAGIAPVELRYASTSAFADDFLRGRQPVDRQEHSVRSAPLALQVRALPVAGRPADFTGAVGEFTLRAHTTARTVRVGEVFALEVEIHGDGNLERMAPLGPPPLAGFHVQGVRERRLGSGRTFVLDVLALRAGVDAVPGVPFAAFSPREGGFVRHLAGPVPIVVLPAAGPLAADVQALVDADRRARRGAAAWWWSLVLVGAAAAGWAWWRGRRRRHARAAALDAAVLQLGAAAAAGPDAALQAYELLLARCAGAGAFAADTVWPGLAAAGVPADLVGEAQRLHAALDAARFGGSPVAAAAVQRLAAAVRGRCGPTR